jgi:hypothetical protein
MANDHVKIMESKIQEFRNTAAELATPKPMDELITIIHRPGWTTPAELALVTSALENMTGATRMLVQSRSALLKAAEQVKGSG